MILAIGKDRDYGQHGAVIPGHTKELLRRSRDANVCRAN